MKFGITAFATSTASRPSFVADQAEQRAFESVWFADHSHIPVERRTRWGGGDEIPSFYYEAFDPVVALADAAAGSSTIHLGFGVALLMQRDVIQFAKSVASLDSLSGGRIQIGVGAGWNIEEMENHGTDPTTRYKRMRESVEAMRVMFTEDEPEYHGDIIDFDPIVMHPKPAACPKFHIGGAGSKGLGRAVRYGDGWMPIGGRGDDFIALSNERRDAEQKAGRAIEFTVFAGPTDPAVLADYHAAGIDRVLFFLFPGTDEQTTAQLDQYAQLIQQLDF